MFKIKKTYYRLGAVTMLGMMTIGEAHAAAAAAAAGGNNFGNIAANITTSIANVPGLLTALAYMFGILLGTLGVMKIKDHVENPSQTPLKDGAIRLAAGGALFALPIIFEAMSNTLDEGTDGADTVSATLKTVQFNVED
jgi:hypothetical protein